MATLGALLGQLRNDAKLSLKDVYKVTGISDSKLYRIEHGKNNAQPSPDTLKTLSKLYGVNPIELYLAAGYLDADDLCSYERVFQNTELLTPDEKENIQTQINLFTKDR